MGKENRNGILMEAQAHLDLHAAPGGQGTGDFTWAVGASMVHGSSLLAGTAQHGMAWHGMAGLSVPNRRLPQCRLWRGSSYTGCDAGASNFLKGA